MESWKDYLSGQIILYEGTIIEDATCVFLPLFYLSLLCTYRTVSNTYIFINTYVLRGDLMHSYGEGHNILLA